MDRLESYLNEKKLAVEEALKGFLPDEEDPPARLHKAMAYSVFAGGKRVRPILAIAAAEACGAKQETVMPAACALELIHTYSLIHDDLPCMDDDDLRRGRPTNHKVFGETMAVLAGDALLAHAFFLIAENAQVKGVKAEAVLETASIVATAASSLGMVGGQAADWMAAGNMPCEEEVLFIHSKKTGALIRASVLAGAILAGAGPGNRDALERYGDRLGLLFQIVDDILDVEGDPKLMGKATGSDAAARKATYPAVMGLDRAKARARELCQQTKVALAEVAGPTDILSSLSDFVLNRHS